MAKKKKKTEPMIEVNTLEVGGMVSAFKALRLPYGLSPRSHYRVEGDQYEDVVALSWMLSYNDEDKQLMHNLIARGDEHAKCVRGIVVWAEIKAPMYWWCEMETYRAGHERLASSSTMHIDGRGMSPEEIEKMKAEMPAGKMLTKIDYFSYQTLRRIWLQRRDHRLKKTWGPFCEWIKTLPLADELILVEPKIKEKKDGE